VSTWVVDVTVVDACPPGTYSTAGDCIDCPTDTYQHADGASSCLPCPRGSHTSRRAARSVTECAGLELVMQSLHYETALSVSLCPSVHQSVHNSKTNNIAKVKFGLYFSLQA